MLRARVSSSYCLLGRLSRRVVRREHAQQLGLLRRPVGELGVDQRLAALEHLLHHLRLPRRQRLAEHDADEVGDRRIAREQHLGAIAL